ncbi:replication-associated recombination protein A [Arcanobacterium bovis]|uniref:Replication-associated recombination protein A n=1 Tax=Arcanobacterium bovis TaxID=2529275 RepID=A0A4Q9V1D1_9ACTO|nr:replication-associated recombination protein A [Arcanobacterium bovis]TBW22904.1 replication-associated recombination protein A [Arcanobacterium bovis]
MDLFSDATLDDSGTPKHEHAPLAVRMRPRAIGEVLGQDHLLKPGQPLRRLIEGNGNGAPSSIFLWGPPGIGKTTLAYLCAGASGRIFTEVSAVSAGVKELRAVIDEAKHRLFIDGKETILFVDEVHRFSKTQQDALLPAVENRWVILVAATTENPSFSVISPLLSRSLLLTLHPLSPQDIETLIQRALTDERGLDGKYEISPDALEAIVRFAGQDARRSLTILEAAAARADSTIELADVEASVDSYAVRYDRDGDQHYDVISAFIKSIRGSDADAAIHYLARMLEAGEDPRFVARRLMISAAEDVGMADPSALQTATAAAQSVALVGMPEARIILAEAVVHLATAPKSNRAYNAINSAIADVREGKIGPVPMHLRDKSVKASRIAAKQSGKDRDYIYAHDEPGAIARQTYLPEELLGTVYYEPSDRGYEANVTARLERINKALGKE